MGSLQPGYKKLLLPLVLTLKLGAIQQVCFLFLQS